MTKPVYLVRLVRVPEQAGDIDVPVDSAAVPPVVVHTVRASNRREAMILARTRYPDHQICSRVVKRAQPRRS